MMQLGSLHGVGHDLLSINKEPLLIAKDLARIPSVCAVVLEHVPAHHGIMSAESHLRGVYLPCVDLRAASLLNKL